MELAKMKKHFEHVDTTLTQLQDQNAALLKERNLLLSDMQQMLNNRKQMESIRTAIGQMAKKVHLR